MATVVWALGVLAHVYLASVLARELTALPPDGRPATATLFVPFVGQIAAPVGGVGLGFPLVSWALFVSAIVIWLALTPFVLRRLTRVSIPPPMRPGVFILLAPPAIGLVAYDRLDPGGPLVWPLFIAATATLLALLARGRWLTEGGWTPAWGAFTFPSAAFAGACLVMAQGQLGRGWDWLASVALVAASLITLYIALRTGRALAKGDLRAG
jgi:tellurite resistance protein